MAGFNDIYGQDAIKEYMGNVLETRQVSHAYIIAGEKDSGKEFIAGIFACALQCEKGGVEPCGECHSCRQALSGNHPDIIRVVHEKPGSIGVEDILGQVNNDIVIKPYYGPYKIYIINEGEKMTVQAQNALLKTLEEPPAYGIILILTANAGALLPTIQSRCVKLEMKPVRDDIVRRYLMEELKVPDYKANVCVAFARGNIGRAKLLASSEDFDRVKEEAVTLLKYIHELETAEIVAAIKKINEFKLDVTDYLDLISIWYRDVLLFKATNDANHLIFREEIKYIRREADRTSYEGLEKILDAVEKAKQRLLANVNFDLTMQLMCMTIQEN